MNRMSKVLVTLSAATMMAVPVCAKEATWNVLEYIGGVDTLIMAGVLAAFAFFMQKFIK